MFFRQELFQEIREEGEKMLRHIARMEKEAEERDERHKLHVRQMKQQMVHDLNEQLVIFKINKVVKNLKWGTSKILLLLNFYKCEKIKKELEAQEALLDDKIKKYAEEKEEWEMKVKLQKLRIKQ